MPVRVGLRYTFVTLASHGYTGHYTNDYFGSHHNRACITKSISSCTYSVNSLQHSVQGVSIANKVNNISRLLARLIGTTAIAGHLPLFNTEQSALPKNMHPCISLPCVVVCTTAQPRRNVIAATYRSDLHVERLAIAV